MISNREWTQIDANQREETTDYTDDTDAICVNLRISFLFSASSAASAVRHSSIIRDIRVIRGSVFRCLVAIRVH